MLKCALPPDVMKDKRKVARMKAVLNITLAALLAGSTLPAITAKSWQPSQGHIMTRWAKQVNPQKALPEYPRPQMQRKAWQNLNGLWDYTLTDKDASAPTSASTNRYSYPIPTNRRCRAWEGSVPDKRLWYHRTFSVPAAWNGSASCCTSARSTGTARLRSTARRSASTGAATMRSPTTSPTPSSQARTRLVVSRLTDPQRRPDAQPRGKQRLQPGGIFYTPQAASGRPCGWSRCRPRASPTSDHAGHRPTKYRPSCTVAGRAAR